jgi:predicted amidophosphoribosyltransferase
MKEDYGIIAGSVFGGVVAIFFAAIMIMPYTIGYTNLFVALLFILFLFITILIYVLVYIHEFNTLCHNAPYGIIEWAWEKRYIASVEAPFNKLSFSQKKEAVRWKETIKIKDLEIRDEYDKIAFSYHCGLDAFVIKTKKTNKIFIIHHKGEIIHLDKIENQKARLERLKNQFNSIRELYPLGVALWMKNNLITSSIGCEQIEKAQEEISLIAQLEEQEKKRIAKIEAKEKRKRELVSWKSDQSRFASHCRDLRDKFLGDFGCYSYDIDISISGVYSDEKYTVWQMFGYSYCSVSDLDYTHFQSKRNMAIKISHGEFPVYDKFFEDISNYINHINAEEPTSIYCCPPADESLLDKYATIYIRFSEYLDEAIQDNYMYLPSLEDFFVEYDEWAKKINRRVFVIDVCTENERLKEICKEISSKFVRKRPLINFISLCKGFDREEMMKLIETENRKQEEVEAKKRKEKEAHHKLITAVSSWEDLWDGFRYTYLFYYYPTTCEFEANEEEWDNRYTIWNFKNDSEKGISDAEHEEAIGIVLPQIQQRLVDTFGEESLQYLTLACLPASTKDKNKARYKDFSERLCEETGMQNGYEHIHILKDGLSKKNPNNTTGHSIQPKVAFDDWFKGKYVLMFDDVVTKGGTMLRYKNKLEEVGAIVVGGLCLGKTKHTRVED